MNQLYLSLGCVSYLFAGPDTLQAQTVSAIHSADSLVTALDKSSLSGIHVFPSGSTADSDCQLLSHKWMDISI
jgi:hypothetical protein